MSQCSFLSDPDLNNSETQSFLDFSLDTSEIEQISNQVNPTRADSNLKYIQKLLFQCNFYLRKLEFKMLEVKDRLEIEICIRKVKAHQTVLSLKINEASIDSSFMAFVREKHQKLLKDIGKVLGISDEHEVTQGCDTTGICTPQATPAFSAQKIFSFKEIDSLDNEISFRVNSVFYKFFQYPYENEALEAATEGNFDKKFPKFTESLQKVVKSLGIYKTMSRSESISSSESRCKENSKLKTTETQKCIKNALSLQELHLNLGFLHKNQSQIPKNPENISEFTQTLNNDHTKNIKDLESQLINLHKKLESLQKENEEIREYQSKLLTQISKNKGLGKENYEFFKDRYENSNRILMELQDNNKKVALDNERLKEELRKNNECIGYLGMSGVLNQVNGARYELAAGIKDLEKVQKEVASEGLNKVLASLHRVSLSLILKEISEKQQIRVPRIPLSKVQGRSKSSLKSASEQLEQYILNY